MRRATIPAAGLLIVVLAVGGVVTAAMAWACVPQPLVAIQPRASGPAGSQVTVQASAVNGDVELRWNGIQGPELGKATGPSFSLPVTIPQAPEGLYAIIAVERLADGSARSTGRAAFLVTGAGSPAPAPAALPPPPAKDTTTGGPSAGVLALAALGLLGAGAAGGALATRRRKPDAAVATPVP